MRIRRSNEIKLAYVANGQCSYGHMLDQGFRYTSEVYAYTVQSTEATMDMD